MFMINEKNNGPGSSSFDHEQYVDHKYFPMFQNTLPLCISHSYCVLGAGKMAASLLAYSRSRVCLHDQVCRSGVTQNVKRQLAGFNPYITSLLVYVVGSQLAGHVLH